jgi:hypothetical protein
VTALDRLRFRLRRDAFARIALSFPDGQTVEGVVPVRAFPVTAPLEGIALVDGEGHEVAWIERLDRMPQESRALIEEELASREFAPEIRRLLEVSSFATPSTWRVETDRGPTSFVLKAEEDIRWVGAGALRIADSLGIQFLIRDLKGLDQASRRLLDRFL